MRAVATLFKVLPPALCGLWLAAACERAPPPEAPAIPPAASSFPAAPASTATSGEVEPAAAWHAFVDGFIEAHLAAHPTFAVAAGRHEYDGVLPDWSRAGIAAEIDRLRRARDEALAFPSAELGPRGEYQRDYFLAVVDRALFWMDKAEWPFVSPAFYFDGMMDSLDPGPYVSGEYAPASERMVTLTRYAEHLPRAAGQIRENLRMPMARTRLELGIAAFGGLAEYFRDEVPGVFAGVRDPRLQARFVAASGAAAEAMTALAGWLTANRDTATDDYALGPDLFRQMLFDTERIEITLPELEAMGREDLRRNQLALGEACAEFAPGETVPACFAKMADRKPQGGPVAAARRQLEELRAFVVQYGLVSIPGAQEARVAQSPPYARSNSAYISIPGPYAVDQPSVYYISPPDPGWPEAVQHGYVPGEADLLFTSVHEVWPGHFLHFLHVNRAPWNFSRLFVTYAAGEGWAHYAEEMMLEAGLRGASAETRIGQLSNALTRNARLLAAIGLHTQGMRVSEAERLFTEQAYQDAGTARQQAERGTDDPAYLNYTLGKLMILGLREEWVARHGGRDAWPKFHDTFLSFGGPPIPLVRAQMMSRGGD